MFGMKKEKIVANTFDKTREQKLYQLFDAQRVLRERVEQAIIKNGVINIYPDGADKDLAIADAEKAKHLVLCAVGTLDSIVNDYRNYCIGHNDEFVTTASWGLSNSCYGSHAVIEEVYKDFFKKG